MQTENLKVTGLNSIHCIDTVTRALKSITGVKDVSVSLIQSKVTVLFDGNLTGATQLETALKNAGFPVRALESTDLGQGSCCGGCCG
jgi:copper chaperone